MPFHRAPIERMIVEAWSWYQSMSKLVQALSNVAFDYDDRLLILNEGYEIFIVELSLLQTSVTFRVIFIANCRYNTI